MFLILNISNPYSTWISQCSVEFPAIFQNSALFHRISNRSSGFSTVRLFLLVSEFSNLSKISAGFWVLQSKLQCFHLNRARIFKRLWSPGIDSKESIPPAYEVRRAGTITLFLLGSYPHRLFQNSSSEFLHFPKISHSSQIGDVSASAQKCKKCRAIRWKTAVRTRKVSRLASMFHIFFDRIVLVRQVVWEYLWLISRDSSDTGIYLDLSSSVSLLYILYLRLSSTLTCIDDYCFSRRKKEIGNIQ